ncbi:plasmid recombination protein [Vibrio alginolyticus]|uniref:MobV family relaxase n=1 Tax=Vibrio alginolyticus TaxID=663 RepID=UPI001BD5D720|nr:MobV family relaxase [Vibrio alginolyticus]MBS9898126.1 plasmid recombination protein [Vibrio alginolyticus]
MDILKTILRFEKIKTYEALNLANGHANRFMETLNSDELKTMYNKKIYGSKNMVKDVKQFFQDKGLKPRKGAVLAMDGLMTLSPEFFKDKQSQVDFVRAASNYLKETFGNNLLSIHFHVDERSPHIHFYVVPINEKGKLSAYDCFNKKTLPKFQEGYCNYMSKALKTKFDYEKGSKAKHKDVKEYYTLVNETVSPMKKEIEDLKKSNHSLRKNLYEEEDKNFQMENEIKELKKEIGKLKTIMESLKNEIKKWRNKFVSVTKKNNKKKLDSLEMPELTPVNFPDIKEKMDKQKPKKKRGLRKG